jgi:hypothetical protein
MSLFNESLSMTPDDFHKELEDYQYLSLPGKRNTSLQGLRRTTLSPSPQDSPLKNQVFYKRRRAMTFSSTLRSSSRKKTVSDSPSNSSTEDITFKLRFRNAYYFSYNDFQAQALEKYLSTLDFKRLHQFFLKNLAQFPENELHLTEWACTYLIAKNKLSVTLEDIRSYPFVLRVISRINGWRKQSLLEKYASVPNQQEAIYDPLFGYSIISFLYKISEENKEISIFNSQVKPLKSTDIPDKSGEIKNITISSHKRNRALIIYDPMRISDEKNSPFYIEKLIKKRVHQHANANNKRKETMSNDNEFKLLYILSKGKHIAIIEMSISTSSHKIVIRNPNSLLTPEVIQEVTAIAGKNKYRISVKTEDNQLGISQLENYYYITKSISDFLIPDTLKITPSGNRDKFLFNEIENNLKLSKPHCFFDLFKVSILWDGYDFYISMGASKESNPLESNPLEDKDFIKIANKVSTLMLSTLHPCSFMNKEFKASKSILDVDIELLKIYHNLFYAIKSEKPIVAKPEKSPISRFFTKTNKEYKFPASLLRIKDYLINHNSTTKNDLRGLLSNPSKAEGAFSSNGAYQSAYIYYSAIISPQNSFDETRRAPSAKSRSPR